MKDIIRMNQLAGIITEGQAKKMLGILNENETLRGFAQNPLSPKMQRQFDMVVSALKKAKTEEEVDKIYYKIVMLPNKVSKIFFDKLVDMGLAEYEGEGISLNFDN